MHSEKTTWLALVLLLVLDLLPMTVLAQKSPQLTLPTPPGTVQLSDNLFIDKAEVANFHWQEYLYHIKRDSTAAFYQSQIADSTLWTILVSRPNTNPPESDTQYYNIAPGYRFYPLVGITHEQALAYCKWRSEVVNKGFFQSKDFLRKHPKLRDFVIQVEYRLPTEDEWQQAASVSLSGHNFSTPIPVYAKTKLSPVYLSAPAQASCRTALGLPNTGKVYQLPYNLQENYYSNEGKKAFFCADNNGKFALHTTQAHPAAKLGLYHLIGNVAEMTAAKGIAKGGSFKTSVHGLTLASRQDYQGPQSWLGFRCVATVRVVPRVRQ
jgi:formylglycine-generating enzyme required for sulfatase activity